MQTTKNSLSTADTVFGEYFLTTVYPTDTLGAHGNSGDKMAGKDVFSSGKGRKCLEISGNRYSQILWERAGWFGTIRPQVRSLSLGPNGGFDRNIKAAK